MILCIDCYGIDTHPHKTEMKGFGVEACRGTLVSSLSCSLSPVFSRYLALSLSHVLLRAVCLFLYWSLVIQRSRSRALALSRSCFRALSISRSRALVLSRSLALSRSFSLVFFLSLALAVPLSCSIAVSHSLPLSLSPSLRFSLSPSLLLSLSPLSPFESTLGS